MLRILFAIVALSSLMSDGRANAKTPQSCSVLVLLDRFPADLSVARSRIKNRAKMLTRVNQAKSAIHNNILAGVSLNGDVKQIKLYADAIAQQLKNPGKLNSHITTRLSAGQIQSIKIQIKKLIDLFGCQNDVTRTKDNYQPVTNAKETQSILTFTENLFSPGTLLVSLSFLICIIGLPIWYSRSETAKRAAHRRGCLSRALMTFGNNCTVTYVSNINQGGAKLQAPIVDIPTDNVELYLAGYRIEAQKVWANDYFLGVKFKKPISEQAVTDIVEAYLDKDQLTTIGENATDCFYPGCHTSCKKHRATQISVKKAS